MCYIPLLVFDHIALYQYYKVEYSIYYCVDFQGLEQK